jgi:hypothetical protein
MATCERRHTLENGKVIVTRTTSNGSHRAAVTDGEACLSLPCKDAATARRHADEIVTHGYHHECDWRQCTGWTVMNEFASHASVAHAPFSARRAG